MAWWRFTLPVAINLTGSYFALVDMVSTSVFQKQSISASQIGASNYYICMSLFPNNVIALIAWPNNIERNSLVC